MSTIRSPRDALGAFTILRLLMLPLLFVLLLGTGCGGLGVDPNGKLACGVHGECPSGLTCAPDKRCRRTGSDGAVADRPQDIASNDGSTTDTVRIDGGAPEVMTCPLHQHLCPVGCVMDDSPQTCGTSCTPCLDPTNGGSATCDGTQCGGTCPSGKKLCLGDCIDAAAVCSGKCPMGTHLCGQSCPSSTDVNSCGTSCVPCNVPANAVAATCDGTTCGFTCKLGYHACGQACLADTDANGCGSLCVTCPTDPNGSPVCAGGGCAIQCNATFHLCGTKCVSNSDVGSCGSSSCSSCPPVTGGSATCDGTKCGGACPNGQQLCNGACIAASAACGPCPNATHNCGGICVGSTDTNSCGTLCGACAKPTGADKTTCDGTTCGFTCGSGYHACGTTSCAANDDATACGATCVKCPTDPNGTATCTQNGTCGLSCGNGYHVCGNKCVSSKDVNTCGTTSCGPACAAPTGGTVSCDGVSCIPVCTSSSQYICQGVCIDKSMACGGTCTVANTRSCSGFCKPNDINACGASCQACSPPANGTATCNGTACGIACNGTFRNCAGTNLCVGSALPNCCVSSECTARPAGTVGVCSNNLCTYPCDSASKACNGACIPATNCCTNGDCTTAAKPVCSGGTCVGRTNGSLCGGNTECATGNCVDGVCCDSACGGQCQACDINGSVGTCATVTSGPPHRAATPVRALCGGDPACGGTCNGASPTKCTYPANQCRGQSCSNNIQVNAAVCDANGVCPAAATVACAPAPCGLGCVNGACKNVSAASRVQCGTFPDTTQVFVDSYPNTVYLLCDGQGGCKGPTFNCGTGGACTISSSIACCNLTFYTQVTSCTSPTSCYDPSTGANGGSQDDHEKCKDTLDCPSGLVCCKAESYGFRGLFCAASCSDFSASPVCDPSRVGNCPSGKTCQDNGGGVGEGFCQ